LSLGFCIFSICVATFFLNFFLLVYGCNCLAYFQCVLLFVTSFFNCLCLFVIAVMELIKELDNHFPQCALPEAMGIVYPQYWLQPNCDYSSTKHIKTLKASYYEPIFLGFGG
jgi:hypothetical protein